MTRTAPAFARTLSTLAVVGALMAIGCDDATDGVPGEALADVPAETVAAALDGAYAAPELVAFPQPSFANDVVVRGILQIGGPCDDRGRVERASLAHTNPPTAVMEVSMHASYACLDRDTPDFEPPGPAGDTRSSTDSASSFEVDLLPGLDKVGCVSEVVLVVEGADGSRGSVTVAIPGEVCDAWSIPPAEIVL